MIEVTGVKTNIKYYINPDYITCFYEASDGETKIWMTKDVAGPKGYRVIESAQQILLMMESMHYLGNQ